jgi:hypothetical protein
MMFRMFVVAALIVAAMVAIKDGRPLKRTGLVAVCAEVTPPPGQSGFWEACKAGKLEGRPDLTRRPCNSVGIVDNVEYWRCPERIGSGPGV